MDHIVPRVNTPYIETRRTSWFTRVQMHVDVRAHQIKSVSLSHLKKKTDGYVDRNSDAIDNKMHEFQLSSDFYENQTQGRLVG